jgi:hypothetical protein
MGIYRKRQVVPAGEQLLGRAAQAWENEARLGLSRISFMGH